VVQIALGSPIYFLGVGKVCHITVNVGTILKVSSQTQAKQKPDEGSWKYHKQGRRKHLLPKQPR